MTGQPIPPLTDDERAALKAELDAQGLPYVPEGEAFWDRIATLVAPCFEPSDERQVS